ncbi:MAG: hypothetical protein AAF434_19420 [Pseudomonadota bacterium]
MTYPQLFKSAVASALVAAVVAVTACGGGSSTSEPETSTSYNGPGSKWDFTFKSGGTFEITKRDDAASPVLFTVNGDWVTTSSGFKMLTVTAVSGTGGPSVGDVAWAIDVPGYALLLKPVEAGSDQVIPMVAAGSCPETDLDANWVIVKKAMASDATDSTRDFFGQYSYDSTTGVSILPSTRALDNAFTDQGVSSLGAVTCSDGLADVADAQMYMTNNGGAIVHTQVTDPSDSSFIFALAQKAITNVANFDGNYAGMVFDGNYVAGDRVIPASMSCTSGVCTGSLLSGPENSATSSDPWTLNLSGTVDGFGDGLITGTITDDTSSNSGNAACMVDVDVLNGGQKIISCVVQSPGNNAEMGNAIFTSY